MASRAVVDKSAANELDDDVAATDADAKLRSRLSCSIIIGLRLASLFASCPNLEAVGGDDDAMRLNRRVTSKRHRSLALNKLR